MNEANFRTTVAELVALIDRTKKSLCEAGEPELAERCHVRVLANGDLRLSLADLAYEPVDHPLVEKALTIDPMFQPSRRDRDDQYGG